MAEASSPHEWESFQSRDLVIELARNVGVDGVADAAVAAVALADFGSTRRWWRCRCLLTLS